jgi:hypothetical protein
MKFLLMYLKKKWYIYNIFINVFQKYGIYIIFLLMYFKIFVYNNVYK